MKLLFTQTLPKFQVSKMVHAIKMGWIRAKKKADDPNKFYMLWDKDEPVCSHLFRQLGFSTIQCAN